ncbi:MAG: glucoamylase family protein [Methylocystis sp.]
MAATAQVVRRQPALSDAALLDLVQRQTFLYFWDGAHPMSGLARDRIGLLSDPEDHVVAVGGSGFGVMAIIVATERGWIAREDALARVALMLGLLERATCYHGHFPHFMNGRTGATVPFSRKDDGGDIVETSLLFQGLLCARQYFDRDTSVEKSLRDRITCLWLDVEWNWHTCGGRTVLTWHWSPNNGFSLAHQVRGWNECLLTYVLAAASPRYAINPSVYHDGWAQSRSFLNGHSYYGIELPLGPSYGGPLFFCHYSFCGLDPRGLEDAYADYWRQNAHHVLINLEHCIRNPGNHKGYGPSCWGLTASDDPEGYNVHAPAEDACAPACRNGDFGAPCCKLHAPDQDNGVISPTAALSSFPYAPEAAFRAMRHFYDSLGDRLWGRFGFTDAFSENVDWFSNIYLAIDQGPVVSMIENHRTGLLWNLYMKDPDVQVGLRRLGFRSPHLK